MTTSQEIQRDPSTEIVLGIAEAFSVEVRYFCEDRDVKRAIWSWAFSERKLFHITAQHEGQKVTLDGFEWSFHDGRKAGFSALAHDWFLKLSAWSIWKIEYTNGQFSFNDGARRLLPWQMLKHISEVERIPQGRFLYREYKTRKPTAEKIAAISFLQEAAEVAPSVVLIPFNILSKDATVEILALARLLFAIRLMANYKTNRATKP